MALALALAKADGVTRASGALDDLHMTCSQQRSERKCAEYCQDSIGDSITWGQGSTSIWRKSYPMLLKAKLGEGYWVGNYGKQSATASRSGDLPMYDQNEFQSSRFVMPNIIVIMLGTNDAKTANWNQAAYAEGMTTIIQTFLDKESVTSVFVAEPPPVYEDGAYGIQADVVNQMAGSPVGTGFVADIVKAMDSPRVFLVDVYSKLGGAKNSEQDMFYGNDTTGGNDGIHPTDLGHAGIFEAVFNALVKEKAVNLSEPMSPPPGPVPTPIHVLLAQNSPPPSTSPSPQPSSSAPPSKGLPSPSTKASPPLTKSSPPSKNLSKAEEEFDKAFGVEEASGDFVASSSSYSNTGIFYVALAVPAALLVLAGVRTWQARKASTDSSGAPKVVHSDYGSMQDEINAL
ncbi:hypothetical protein CYMTET_33389 [Cymbomonas tetramitiformis]|uniref:SGNH hydrolase-type esterase domain-containing protein n=1 Tax=Cymbomonas tetramitiformis TaxID=36881 RepID=A0AAE0FCY1_9CHLO|nr:hypothetical protein CYMTET_33389 [Cymbomonas tetramitiformis]